ncbi:MAG: Ig-like domain-containing protein, partial [Verrucomicrobia bacterium]|nr:Ig-like domain-containing protein [Verrucomicrobiota bacterium]
MAGSTDLVATFTENIARGTGNITIKNLDTLALTEIPVTDPQVSVSGPVLTIHPTAGLAALTNYAIRIDDTAITDIVGNPFAGIADDTTWTFTTMAQV